MIIIKLVNGNILNASENIICHQVNCQGVMGAGLAKQIRNKYPEVYTLYKQYLVDHGKEYCLGSWQLVSVGKRKSIANIFGQNEFGRNKQYTDYDALKSSLFGVYKIAKEYNMSIAIPYGIGCGLAGGDWNVVYQIIEDVFKDYEVTIYKLV